MLRIRPASERQMIEIWKAVSFLSNIQTDTSELSTVYIRLCRQGNGKLHASSWDGWFVRKGH